RFGFAVKVRGLGGKRVVTRFPPPRRSQLPVARSPLIKELSIYEWLDYGALNACKQYRSRAIPGGLRRTSPDLLRRSRPPQPPDNLRFSSWRMAPPTFTRKS